MWKLRVLGLGMLVYGAGMLLLLQTQYRDWALDHSIAEAVSHSDRRVNNEISGSVDEPMAIAGSAVMVFAGLWIGLLVPGVLNRNQRRMMAEAEGPPGPPGPESV